MDTKRFPCPCVASKTVQCTRHHVNLIVYPRPNRLGLPRS